MTSANSPPEFDRPRLHELASEVMNGTASETQLRELSELLRGSMEAQDEYLSYVDLHALLSTDLTSATSDQPANPNSSLQTVATDSSQRHKLLVASALLALSACLLVALTLFRPADSSIESKSFARLAQLVDAVWSTEGFDPGSRIGSTTMRLQSGFVRIEFDSGVEVTLEGPAEFKLIDANQTRLVSGLLTATVPPGAEGFTVDTPSAQVIDLGTSFGIDIGADGFSNVSVFDGEVEVSPRDTTEKRLLTEGESIRIGQDLDIEDIDFDLKRFAKMWPTASGITSSTESIRFIPPWPKQIRFVQNDAHVFLRPEGHRVRLKSELNVNVSQPGHYTTVEQLTPSAIQAKQSVRSYILHYSPETQLGRRRAKRVTGSISFARPVLGIMVNHEELAASSRRFGRRGAGESNQRRELNLTGDPSGDRITLSDDRRTVTVDLVAPGRTSDLMRVVVDGSGGPRSPARRERI